MNPAQTRALRQLFQDQRIAALGTLHEGEPFVSMTPYALLREGFFVVHVSDLSSHTMDMLDSPRVSLLVVSPDTGDAPPQSLARASIQGRAEKCADGSSGVAAAREAYLGRFPQAVDLVEIPGFSFFAIRPSSIRFIAGFAQATTLTPESFATALVQS